MTMLKLIHTLLILSIFSSHLSHAGTLDDLEEAATKPKSKSSATYHSNGNQRSNSNDRSGDSGGIAGFFVEIIVEALAQIAIELTSTAVEAGANAVITGGGNSFDRYNSDGITTGIDSNQLYRKKGDPILPTVSLSSHWLNADQDINAQLNRVEVGYGAFGLSHTQNRLTEPDDKLTLSNTLFHYRMSLNNDISWDFAFGRGKMNGNQVHEGSVFAMPIRMRVHPKVHLEYYPTWSSYNGGSLAEHQFSVNWHHKHLGITTGYKKWSAGETTVKGFFTGLNLSF